MALSKPYILEFEVLVSLQEAGGFIILYSSIIQ